MSGLFGLMFFSRFDGACINSSDEGIEIMFRGGEGIRPQEIVLYCSSDASITGFHHDPMVLRQSGRASENHGRGRTEARVKKDPLSLGVSRKRQKNK